MTFSFDIIYFVLYYSDSIVYCTLYVRIVLYRFILELTNLYCIVLPHFEVYYITLYYIIFTYTTTHVNIGSCFLAKFAHASHAQE